MPRRQIVRLPNDHTHGASANKPSPHAHMAVKQHDSLVTAPHWHGTAQPQNN